jgi:hypothetical protein
MIDGEQNDETDWSETPPREAIRPSDWLILSVLALIISLWVVFLVKSVRSFLGI